MVWANAEVGNLNDKAIQMKSDYMFCSQTERETKATYDAIRIMGQFSLSLPQTGATGVACGVRLPAQVRATAAGPGLAPLPAVLSFLVSLPSSPFWLCMCMCGSAGFALQSRQIEKSEERLINQELHSEVNKKRWHHIGQWERLFREGRELQEQIQLSQHR